MLIGLLLVCCTGYVLGVELPPEVYPCPHKDANYEECIPKAIESAVRYLGKGSKLLHLPKIDPVVAKEIVIEGNGGKVDLHQEYFDLNIVKHSDSTIKNVDMKIGKDDCHIKMQSDTPLAHLIGRYKVSGKMLLFTLKGHGNVNITLVNLHTIHHIECEIVDKNGEDHIKVTKYNVEFNPEKLMFDLDNLIDGNPELSANVLQVMNDNSMEIFGELKRDYEVSIGQLFKHVTNSFFDVVPVKLIFPDWY